MVKSRKKEKRSYQRNVYIFCGGEKTEKFYFEGMRSFYKYPNFSIITKGVSAYNFIQKIDYYLEKIDTSFDLVYLVLDRDPDNNPREHIEKLNKICKENGVELIISNKAFEVWFLLHFGFFKKKVSSVDEYIKELGSYIGEKYHKNDKGIYSRLKDYESAAVSNSKQLEDYHKNDGVDDSEIFFLEPYTNMYKMIENIRKVVLKQ